MSDVTTVIVMVPYIPDEIRKRILNETWDPARPWDELGDINPATATGGAFAWGGSKYPEAEIFGGGYNHFNEDKFFEWLGGMNWGQYWPTVLVAMSNQVDSMGSWGAYEPKPFRIRGLDAAD